MDIKRLMDTKSTKDTESKLRAEAGPNGWIVRDPEGGVWHPSEYVQGLLAGQPDSAALAVAICEVKPMMGTWYQ